MNSVRRMVEIRTRCDLDLTNGVADPDGRAVVRVRRRGEVEVLEPSPMPRIAHSSKCNVGRCLRLHLLDRPRQRLQERLQVRLLPFGELQPAQQRGLRTLSTAADVVEV